MIKYLVVNQNNPSPHTKPESTGLDEIKQAEKNLAFISSTRRRKELGSRIITIVERDRLKQYKHDHHDKQLYDSAFKQSGKKVHAYAEDADPALSLVRLHEHITRQPGEIERIHRSIGHKGVSLTLGSIPQLGDWDAGHKLDELFREFPDSPLLKEAGFSVADDYADQSTSQLSYGFGVVKVENGMSLMGVRKRAAADIQTTEGIDYDIIKRTSFLVDIEDLDQEEIQVVSELIPYIFQDQPIPCEVRNTIGRQMIEPFIKDKSLRSASSKILPANSIYYALHRFK
jgi:hypothetical protein